MFERHSRWDELRYWLKARLPEWQQQVTENAESLRQRLDEWNRALASQALPDARRARVSRLVLERKNRLAAQRRNGMKVVRRQVHTGRSATE
ncbi:MULTISPECIES: hypothetical protein [Marinobacter]|uniref:hypothetical protein n=1 Tax=Marinobacter TaxID=2742 RepID=UPI001D07544B|nr:MULTISPECIES: hypothetical protein [Marinobacter]MCG8516380.1 hypothetical protein [Pseudomonadales bacterium]MCK7567919.1 hypothetical protein [Marinobacter xestospongiae]UDL03763.1 hypothetical protein J2887_13675 [Marinobacter sp. CA1]